MAVSNRITVKVEATETATADAGTPILTHIINFLGMGQPEFKVYPTGTTDASQQQDIFYSDSISLAAAATDLDLAGVLTSKLTGATLTWVEVTGFIIVNRSTTATENITVGGDANALVNWIGGATETVVVGPNGMLMLTSPIDGYAVTAGTGDILQLDPGADTITCDFAIWGRSA